jgi:hypothetical protein
MATLAFHAIYMPLGAFFIVESKAVKQPAYPQSIAKAGAIFDYAFN